MRIDFNSVELLDLEGNAIVETYERDAAGKLKLDEFGEPIPKTFARAALTVAGMLANAPNVTDKTLKVGEMARRIAKDGAVDLDTDDLALLKDIVKSNQSVTPLVRADILAAIRRAEVIEGDEIARKKAQDA